MPSFIKPLSVAAAALFMGLAVNGAQANTYTFETLLGGAIADGGNADGTAPSTTPYLFFSPTATGTITGVSSASISISHTYVGDLKVVLRFQPTDPTAAATDAVLFDGVNYNDADPDFYTFNSNNLNGTYSFANSATQTLQAGSQPDNTDATVPNGTYLPSAFYDQQFDPPVIVNLSSVFAGKDLASGVFELLITDSFAGDQGTLTSAQLTLTTAVPEPASLAAVGMLAGLVARRRR